MKNIQKHILVFNRSFWPDVEATGQFLTELCEELAKRSKVTVIAGRSYYESKETFKPWRFYGREEFNGVEILRVRHTKFWKGWLPSRIINWLTYTALAFFTAIKIRPKIIVACTDPPFLGIISIILSRLKYAHFIYNCEDLFPDVAIELGRLKKYSILAYIYDYVNKKAFHSALAVICLGSSMKNRIINKGILKERIRIIPHWVDISKIRPIPKNENPLIEKFGLRDKFIIMHSGNIGLSQNFGSILQAVNTVENKSSFCLVFVGEGSGKKKLQDEINLLGLTNILFLPYQPLDMLSFSLSMADLHLVTFKKGMGGTIVPSKVYGIMGVGRPYLAITDKESEPACMAMEFNCGLWAAPDDLNAITQAIKWAITHPNELEEMGKNSRYVAEAKFDKKIVINEWFKLLEDFNI